MKKNNKKLIYILVISILIIINCLVSNVYALTPEEQELMQILTEYKTELGDLNEFKQVIDQVYNDISSANTVDDTLKAQLTADIAKLENVTNINPLILNVLEVELSSHIANLTNENLSDVKQEFSVIKQWTDTQIANDTNNTDGTENPSNPSDSSGATDTTNPIDTNNPSQIVDDSVVKDSKLPQTGKSITILLVSLFLLANIFISIKKYKDYKQV